MHAQPCEDIVEVPLVVIDDGPAAAPPGKAVDFGQGTSADDRDGARCIAEGDKGTLRIVRQAIVHLVRDNRNFEFFGDGQNFLDMISGETGTARI